MGFCNDNFYVSHQYNGTQISVLQPAKIVNCYTVGDGQMSEGVFILEVNMYVVLAFLVIVAYRSMNKKSLDFYRLFGFYCLATIGVPVSLRLSPYYDHPGFNRIVGFGILIHNMAEFFILANVWFGSIHTNALPVILYVWGFTILQIFLPLSVLFFVGMYQGAFLDFLLCVTFFYVMKYADTDALKTKYIKRTGRKCYLCMGFGGALLHISSILPLFYSFATMGPFGAATVIFLAPTFILYIWFASADKTAAPNLMRPTGNFGGVYDKTDEAIFEEDRVKSLYSTQNVHGTDVELTDADSAGFSTDANEAKGLIVNERKPTSGTSLNRRVSSYNDDIMHAESSHDIGKQFNFMMLVNKGFMNIDRDFGRAKFKRALIIAFILDTICAPLVFFAPCYFDSTALVCD